MYGLGQTMTATDQQQFQRLVALTPKCHDIRFEGCVRDWEDPDYPNCPALREAFDAASQTAIDKWDQEVYVNIPLCPPAQRAPASSSSWVVAGGAGVALGALAGVMMLRRR